MIVHWFIEPVSYGKESASDIENPFENKNVPHSFVTRRSRQTSKNWKYLQVTKTTLHQTLW